MELLGMMTVWYKVPSVALNSEVQGIWSLPLDPERQVYFLPQEEFPITLKVISEAPMRRLTETMKEPQILVCLLHNKLANSCF